jgi:phosphoglycolate phosphatase/AHBA synthesis associated protein
MIGADREPLDAIVFDLDDTLIATRRLYTEAYLAALELHHGRRLSLAELVALRPGPETHFIPSTVPPDLVLETLERFYRHYEERHPDVFEGLYPGVARMLADLHSTSLRTGVFTGKSRRAWAITARHVHLPGMQAWVFGDEIERPKPAPDGILAVLDKLEVPPARAAYLGDSLLDVAAAQAAGVLPLAALWSTHGPGRTVLRRAAHAAGGIALGRPPDILKLVRPTP